MASNENYTSDKELTEIYNLLDKGSLVKLLIEKYRELEKQVKNLYLSGVVVTFCRCKGKTGSYIDYSKDKEICKDCDGVKA